MSAKKTAIVLTLAVAIQFVFSFFSPAYNPQNECQHAAAYFLNSNAAKMKDQLGVSSGEFSWAQTFFNLFPDYRIICDSTSFLLLGKNFPWSYFDRNIYIDHPLYNFFASLIIGPISFFRGAPPSYPIIFGAFMLVNFLLAAWSVWLFYQVARKFVHAQAAFFAALLLVFSPFFHAMIGQPTSSGIMEIFVVSGGLWLFVNYLDNPNRRRLVRNSLFFGALLLGKQIFALSLFFLIFAVIKKRYKEGALFFGLQFVPTALWYLFVKFILQLPYYMVNVSSYGQGTWFLRPENWNFYKMGYEIISAVPRFGSAAIYGFLLAPILFSLYGLHLWQARYKKIIYFGFAISFLLLSFGMNYYRPSLAFLIFPVVYLTAALAITTLAEKLKQYGKIPAVIFAILVFLTIFVVANANVYRFGIWE